MYYEGLTLKELMATPLPPITYQKKLMYRPSLEEAIYTYNQWFITTLAHEMCHQYQWDVQGIERRKIGKEPIMSHGPSFFELRDKLKKHGISLKSAHGRKRWFKHQDFFKC